MFYLFRGEDLREYLNRSKINLQREIETSAPENILQTDEEIYVKQLISKYSFAPLILMEKDAYVFEKKELERPSRMNISVSNGSMLSGAISLTIAIPFVGNGHLLSCKPSTYTLSPPSGKVVGSEIHLIYQVEERDSEKIAQKRKADLNEIKRYLEWIKKDIEAHNDWIASNAKKYVKARKETLQRDSDFIKSLGLPIRKKQEEQTIPSLKSKEESTKENRGKFEYDFFICHASEDKESFVRKLAISLRKKGFKIWYDEFTLSLGDSLRRKIDSGLTNSRYGIVILSKYFFNKKWPQDELDGLVAKEREGKKIILPIWHGVTEDDVREFSPILAGRLAASTSKGMKHVIKEIEKATEKS